MKVNCNFQRGGEEFIPKKPSHSRGLSTLLNSGTTHINKITHFEKLHQKLLSFICSDRQNKEEAQAVVVLTLQERKTNVLMKHTTQIPDMYLIHVPDKLPSGEESCHLHHKH